jgi:hypothetical protein
MPTRSNEDPQKLRYMNMTFTAKDLFAMLASATFITGMASAVPSMGSGEGNFTAHISIPACYQTEFDALQNAITFVQAQADYTCEGLGKVTSMFETDIGHRASCHGIDLTVKYACVERN